MTAAAGWVVLHIGYGTNDKYKVICRDGARVVHKDHLTLAEAESFTPEQAQAAWLQTIGR